MSEYEPDASVGIFHIVQRVRLSSFGLLLPVLLIERLDGSVVEHPGALSYSRAHLASNNRRTLSTDLATLGRLHDFEMLVSRGEGVRPEDKRTLIWCYLDARYHGTRLREDLAELGWRPVSLTTVRSEFRSIIRYLEFLSSSGEAPREGLQADALLSLKVRLQRDSQDPQREFLGHLLASRVRWQNLSGTGYSMPDLQVRAPEAGGPTISLDRTIDLEELKLIIRNEANPFYRGMWRLGGFGGTRISESLHMWDCDVLPPSTGQHLRGYYYRNVMVLVAHPCESKYLGDFTRTRETRLQHLEARYARRPLNRLQGYRRVGWKNPLMTDSKLQFSEVFWCDPDEGDGFAEDVAEMRSFRKLHEISRRHPYLFVNTYSGKSHGEPIAYSKVRDAFARACRRVGLIPSVNGRRIHGQRHLYKQQLKDLGLSRDQIQITMRHKSIESQEDYGRTSKEIHSQLNRIDSEGDTCS